MKRQTIIMAAVLSAMCLASQARGDTLEQVEKDIHDKITKLKTLQYKTKSVTEMSSPQMSMKSTSDTSIECMQEGGKIYYRDEMKTDSVQKISGMDEQKTKMDMLAVCDGEFLWTESNVTGTKSVTKDKVDPKNANSPFDPLGSFKMLEESYNFKLLPDETVNGKPCHAIEMSPKTPNPMMGKTVSYFDKDTGINLKAVSYDAKGKELMTMLTSDVKVDSSIDRKRFQYTPPTGVKVEDRTKESTTPKTGM